MRIYSLKSKSLGYYNLPFFAENDTGALFNIRNAVLSEQDASLSSNLDDLILVLLGELVQEDSVVIAKGFESPLCALFSVVSDDLRASLSLPRKDGV